jgi:hypothetical protein
MAEEEQIDFLFGAFLELAEAVQLDADGEYGISAQLTEALVNSQRVLESFKSA